MDHKQREILRHHRPFLRKDLEAKKLLPCLANILDATDDQEIRQKDTREESSDKLLEILPRRGPEAFSEFLKALQKVQPHLAEPLIKETEIEEMRTELQEFEEEQQRRRRILRELEELGSRQVELVKEIHYAQEIEEMRTELKGARKPKAWEKEEFVITRKELDDVQQRLRKNLREREELGSRQEILIEEINYAQGKEALQQALETINTEIEEMRTELEGARKPKAWEKEEFVITRKELDDVQQRLRKNLWELEELGSRQEKLIEEINYAQEIEEIWTELKGARKPGVWQREEFLITRKELDDKQQRLRKNLRELEELESLQEELVKEINYEQELEQIRTELKGAMKPGAWQREEFLITRGKLHNKQQRLRKNWRELEELGSHKQLLIKKINYAQEIEQMRTELKGARKPKAWEKEEFVITRKELDDVQQRLRKNLWELEELGSRQKKLIEEINYAPELEEMRTELEGAMKPGAWQREVFLITRKELNDVQEKLRKNLWELVILGNRQEMLVEEIIYAQGKEALQQALETINTEIEEIRTELKGARKPGAWQREEFLITRKELDDVQQRLSKNLWELVGLGNREEMLVEEIIYAQGKTEKQLKEKTVNKDPSPPKGLYSVKKTTKPETGESQLARESSSEEVTQSTRRANKLDGVLSTKTKKKAPIWTKKISISSDITSEGGRVVGEGVKLVCPPGAVERPVTVTVTLEDPSKYCGLLVQNDLENDVMFCAPVINLQPNGHLFKRGVVLTVKLKGVISSFNEVVILHGEETCFGTIAWEDITHNAIESDETGDEVLITTERFSIIAAFIKRTLILPKYIASRLNLLGFNHSLLVLFNDKLNQLAVVFVSEDVENDALFREDKMSVLVQLKEGGFREIFIRPVKGQDDRRIYNHEELKVSVFLGQNYKPSSRELPVVVECSAWWSTGHAIKLPLEGTKQAGILCGRITVKGEYGHNKENQFCELDLHGYIKGSLGVDGDVFNVIPIAKALRLPGELLHNIKEEWSDDECQLEVILHWFKRTDFALFFSLGNPLEGLEQDYRATTKRGQMHVKHIRYFATKIGRLEHESVELEKHFASKIHTLCQMVLRDSCLEMERTGDGVGKAAASKKLDAFIAIRMQGKIPDCLKDFFVFVCEDFSSSSEKCFIEEFMSVVPELIQMIKEVFVDNEADYEEQTGLRGLSDEALAPLKSSIWVSRQHNNARNLMCHVSEILEKLCQQNCCYELKSEVEKWGESLANLTMLEFLKPYFQNCPKNRRLHKRLELFAKQTRNIMSNSITDDFFIRDFANVALSLNDFAKFDASKLVRFVVSSNSRVNCSRENTQFDLIRNPSVFSQTVHVQKESDNELKLYASASVHIGGQVHKIGAFQAVIMLCESGWKSFEKCRSPFHRVTTMKVKDKDSDNLRVVLCSSKKQELSEMLQALGSEMKELVNLTKSQVTQCPLTATTNISAKAGEVLSLCLIYKWGSDSLDLESKDFVVCADSSAGQISCLPELQLFDVSNAAQLDEAAATQANPFPLASADVDFNCPVFQPFSERPLNIQCQKVEYHLHHHNNMMQGHVCVVGDRTSLNNPMPAQGAIEEAQGNFSRLSLTDEK
ncbi:uncharacterized protein [Montipora foliosa]|uniref:uncharacterized protein isoform X4 n=1 Tax=Montipora foliosa TaxID=591990 RepID=UPI0035F1B2FF